jgi:TolB-like protein
MEEGCNMQRSLNSLLLIGLLAISLGFAADADARRLGVVASDGDASAANLVLALQGQSEEAIELDASGLSSEATLRHAAELGCDIVLLLHAPITGYRIEAQLLETNQGRRVATETVSGPSEQVFELIDQLGDLLARDLRNQRLPQGTVAVLDFSNEAGAEHNPFVSGLPQMLLTSLHQDPSLTLVESRQVSKGREALSTGGAISGSSDAVALGRWLGADAAIHGIFTEDLQVRLDVVVAATGRSLGTYERQGTRRNLVQITQELAGELALVTAHHRSTRHTVAVLPFQNHGEAEYDAFVNGLADMLTTSLGQTATLTVIERVQIETAMRNFNLEMSGAIDPETAVEVGAWLGADAVVLGSFLRFGNVFRIDARMIDAETGEVLAADSESGAEDAVMGMVDALGGQLVARFAERVPADAGGTGSLEVLFRMTKAEMGERPSYYHLCKLYVDGKFMETSPLVDGLDEWVALFSRNLRSGAHRVQVVHGFASDRDWDGRMPLQPDSFEIRIEPGATATVRYTFEVGWFKDSYIYDSTWEREPWAADGS